jgi:magnesium-transporting ATPase (P-type)
MLKSVKSNIVFLLSTILVLIVSLAWIDWIAVIRAKWPVFKNQIVAQTVFVLTVTAIGIIFIVWFKPFSSDQDRVSTVGTERIVRDERFIKPILEV